MIDLRLLRGSEAELFKNRILLKEPSFPIDDLIAFEQTVRQLKISTESIQAEKNKISQKLSSEELSTEIRAKSTELSKKLLQAELELKEAEKNLESLWLRCPNFIDENLPVGGKEANKVIRTFGEKADFSFTPKHHMDLNVKANWFDLITGTKIAGSQFVFYTSTGTKIIYALANMMLRHNAKAGFSPVLPPYLANRQSFLRNGSLPKFDGDFYDISSPELSPLPTAEVALTNLHADSIYHADQLPIRNSAWTSCFRKEAGGYGSTERGLIRIHQFEKVEIYSVCKPEESANELAFMVETAEQLLQKLGLHYRVSLLATQDSSFVAAKTYDIEVWLPGQQAYYEVSSCSNCTDFQSRRAKIRYRPTSESKPELAHTLNASSLAIPRLMVALMETYQREDGSIQLPPSLMEEMQRWW